MAIPNTARLGLRQFDTTEQFLNTEVNNNSSIIDAVAGLTICTSSSRPITYLFNGRQIYETDTDTFLYYDGAAWIPTHTNNYMNSLNSTTDLDTVTTQGIYYQATNANATTALHYPALSAGRLVVTSYNLGSTVVWQEYYPLNSNFKSIYRRINTGAAWSAWLEYQPLNDSGYLAGTSYVTTNANWTVNSWAMHKRNGIVTLNMVVTAATAITSTSDGNIANSVICVINNANFRPVMQTGVMAGWGGRIWNGYIQADGTVGINSVGPGFGVAVGDQLYGSATFTTSNNDI